MVEEVVGGMQASFMSMKSKRPSIDCAVVSVCSGILDIRSDLRQDGVVWLAGKEKATPCSWPIYSSFGTRIQLR